MEPIRVYDNPPRDAWPALTARVTRDDAEIDRRVAAILNEVRTGGDEALRRIAEGASMIRTKGEPGTGDVVQAVSHMRLINGEIRAVGALREDELFEEAKRLEVPIDLQRS